MIYKHNFTLPEELAADIADQGMDYLPELLRMDGCGFFWWAGKNEYNLSFIGIAIS